MIKRIVFSLFVLVLAIGTEAQITKELKNDSGYEWVLVRKAAPYGGYASYGAETPDGKILFPVEYKSIRIDDGFFMCTSEDGLDNAYDLNLKCIIPESRGYTFISHHEKEGESYFSVKKGRQAGFCDINGKELISPDRGYTSIYLQKDDDGFRYYSIEKGDFAGIVDSEGREIISPSRGYEQIYRHVSSEDGTVWYQTIKGDFYGACDENGQVIASPRYKGMVFYHNGSFKADVNGDGNYQVLFTPGKYVEIAESVSQENSNNVGKGISNKSKNGALSEEFQKGYKALKNGNYSEATNWFRKGMEKGNPICTSSLAERYENGDGVAHDDAMALKYYLMAVKQWDGYNKNELPLVYNKIGKLYINGDGIKKDYDEAVKWFRKGVAADNTQSYYFLGVCMYFGQGTAEDKAEGKKLIRKAAQRGEKAAKTMIGALDQQ
ncbi:MAG: sel1 repeat family protein [Muribaculaceae bacterium]|nr:sel1 repeat family protein [Muribaculaceae bacterium]